MCGAEYCSEETYQYNGTTYPSTLPSGASKILVSIWLGLAVLGLSISCAFLDSRMKEPQSVNEKHSMQNILQSVKAAFLDPKLQLAAPLTLFIGLEQGFIYADFIEVSIQYTEISSPNISPFSSIFLSNLCAVSIKSQCLFQQAYVVCTLGGAKTVTISFLALASLQALAGVTLSMLLRHIKRYFVVGE